MFYWNPAVPGPQQPLICLCGALPKMGCLALAWPPPGASRPASNAHVPSDNCCQSACLVTHSTVLFGTSKKLICLNFWNLSFSSLESWDVCGPPFAPLTLSTIFHWLLCQGLQTDLLVLQEAAKMTCSHPKGKLV